MNNANKGQHQYTRIERSPRVRTTDLKNGVVKVEMFIDELELGRDKYHPKGGKIHFDFLNSGYAFDMVTELKDKTNLKLTVYKFSVKQLPGRISIDESKWGVEKGKIVVMMEKHQDSRNVDWEKIQFEKSLDQASSSSSSSSSDDD